MTCRAHRVPSLGLGLAISLWIGLGIGLDLCLGGCGSSTPPAKPMGAASADPSPAAALPPLPRSSLAAVLLHRDELQLSDDQVKAIQGLDEELAARAKALTDRPGGGVRPDGGAGQPQGSSGGGGSKRLHAIGGRGGSGMKGGAGSGFHGSSSGSSKGVRSLEERLDDADTRAYIQAEEGILNPEQRDRAREIAEKYREDLYDRRSRTADDKE
jgi:hypothetical protein